MALSPMMQQYQEIKQRYPNCLLFFRLGDFYEMFFDDAKLVSQELELVLTGRDCGLEERAPMCGVPFHSYESYVARLVEKGYKIAICEQLEDPATAKGIVKRDVVRILSPATVVEGSMLDEGKNNYLATLCVEGDEAGICFCDCSTGEIYLTTLSGDELDERVSGELERFSPRELLVNTQAAKQTVMLDFAAKRLNLTVEVRDDQDFDYQFCGQRVLSHFGKASLLELNLESLPLAVRALGCALIYLSEMQKTNLDQLVHLNIYSEAQFMKVDLTARRNLELTETMRSRDKRGSLLGVLDCTKTAMGKRMIRRWLDQPLIQKSKIERRLNAVEELLGNLPVRTQLRTLLADVHDIERIMTRVVVGNVNARELRSLEQTIRQIQPIKQQLAGVRSELLCELEQDIDPLTDVADRIDCTLDEELPPTVREGGIIRRGFSEELDAMRDDRDGGRNIVLETEARERERTGIAKLRVKYNRVFGYYIEVPRLYADQVPAEYIRKQTVANAERYITEDLKLLETRILGANDRAVMLEYQLFVQLRQEVAGHLLRIQQTAAAIGQLDVLCCFAETAMQHRYCRPDINVKGELHITNGRHPVVEAILSAPFVPNDVYMDKKDNRCLILTGPNMAGKSTYMRQTALIVLLAQIGCFVPADRADVGIVDCIFTRVGASDDLSAGQSTFMVEMSEVAHILKNATADSLIIFDEIGRGTSTYDGMSIARAVLEYVADKKKLGAKTLFATHYHELTEVETEGSGMVNYNIAVKKRGDDITFLRRILRGPADDSYGIQVAHLAGIPDDVVARAKQILAEVERNEPTPTRKPVPTNTEAPVEGQISFSDVGTNELVEQLKTMDVDTLTPLEAMQTLYRLCEQAKQQ